MHILMTGGTGFIGRHFIKRYPQYQYTVLTRQPAEMLNLGTNVTTIHSLSSLSDLNQFDAVINLAGEPIVDKRWTSAQKKTICHSRWDLTQQLVELFKVSSSAPETFISGSAIGFYGETGSTHVNEQFIEIKEDFAHQVCETWESIANDAATLSRVAIIRTGIVLGLEGGALKKMIMPFKFGLGGPIASGEQFMSWIHIDDMVSAINFILCNKKCEGAFNLTSPLSVNNAEFTKTLASTVNRPAFFKVPAFILKTIMGESSALLIGSQRIEPEKLVKAGFDFEYPELKNALKHLIKQT